MRRIKGWEAVGVAAMCAAAGIAVEPALAAGPLATTTAVVNLGGTASTVTGSVFSGSTGFSTYDVGYGPESSPWCQAMAQAGAPPLTSAPRPEPKGLEPFASTKVSVELSGLAAGSVYCAALMVHSDGVEPPNGVIVFTAGAPNVSTGTATALTNTTDSLSGTVASTGKRTEYWFEYAPRDGPWCRSDGAQSTISPSHTAPRVLTNRGPGRMKVHAVISGLHTGVSYCWNLVARNTTATSYPGEAVSSQSLPSFKAGKPSARTLRASSITAHTATLEALANTEGGSSFEYGFGWDVARSLFCRSHTRLLPNQGYAIGFTGFRLLRDHDLRQQHVHVVVRGLKPGTTYCFEVQMDAGRQILGGRRWFTTPQH